MNDRWTTLLPQYYDYIQNEYLAWMADEYNLPLDELKAKAEPLKNKILDSVDDVVANLNSGVHKKQGKVVTKAQGGPETPYDSFPRNRLVELCKENGIPVKRKNQDMRVLLLKKLGNPDESNCEASTS